MGPTLHPSCYPVTCDLAFTPDDRPLTGLLFTSISPNPSLTYIDP